MVLENIRLAIKDFFSNKTRTMLSMLGIIIGVASVITITSLGKSATAGITEEISKAGTDTITLFRFSNDSDLDEVFNEDLVGDMESLDEGIANVTHLEQGMYLIRAGREEYEDQEVLGVTNNYADIFHYEIADGRFITDGDNSDRKAVAVLGADIAETLFPDGDAIGSLIRIYRTQAQSFRIVGIMESRSDSLGVSFDTSIYIPYETYSSRLQRIENPSRFVVGVKDDADVLEISDLIENYITRRAGTDEGFRLISPSTIAEVATNITETLGLFLAGVAAISLIVGGIGIMNIMLVSVSERTKEIGIRKALGATPSVIRSQFLIEAISLTGIGGILGSGFGLGLSFIVTLILNWNFYVDVPSLFVAIIFSTLVGVFFGLYPAVKASRLDPVQALSYE